MESLIQENKLFKAQILTNVCYYLNICDVTRLLSTCRTLYDMKDKNEIWIRFFQKDMQTQFNSRKRLKQIDILEIEGKLLNYLKIRLKNFTILCQRLIKLEFYIIKSCIGIKPQDLSKKFEIFIQNPRYDLKVQESQSMLSTMKKLHEFISSKVKTPLKLSAISDSSHDFNQTVHLTLF